MTIATLSHQKNKKTEILHAVFLFLMLFISYVYTFPRWADPNQDSRLKMVVAIVVDGSFQIDKYLGTTVDYAKVGDHYYSDKAPGVAFLGVPIYATINKAFETPMTNQIVQQLENNPSFQGTLNPEGSGINALKIQMAIGQIMIAIFVGAIPSALIGVMIYRWLEMLDRSVGVRILIALAYGLLTPAFAYANTIFGHQLSAALLFASFYWVSTRKEALSTTSLLIIGIFLSYAVVTEYPTILIVGIIFLYIFYRLYHAGQWQKIFLILTTALPVALAWMIYNNHIFGGPLNLGYSYSELWVNQHQSGFMSLTLPSTSALWGITFGLFRGLFVLSPWLLFSISGLFFWWKKGQFRTEYFVILASVLSMYLFNASSGMWWGGFAIGPRYILPALPFLVLPIGFAVSAWKGRLWFWWVLGILMVWSFVAVWGLSLAGQAFPSDALQNPLLEYALPNWQNHQIARNIGTILGFDGWYSLLPLLTLWILLGLGWWLITKKTGTTKITNEISR